MPLPGLLSHVTVRARVVRGYRAASGLCRNSLIPLGTLQPQLRFFRGIPGFGHRLRGRVYPGTINVRLDRWLPSPGTPYFCVAGVRWTRHIAAENFFITPCTIIYRQRPCPAYIYIPDPLTKPGGPPDDGVVEILCSYVEKICYGAAVQVRFPPSALSLIPRPPRWRPRVGNSPL